MSFLRIELLPILLIVWLLFVWLNTREEKNFFNWVRDHWLLRRSKKSKIGGYLYIIAWTFLLVSILDLRGPETLVEGRKIDQKSLIMIDTSTSMLAEDVRPNRFERAYLLAKHFIKKSVGHQVSLVVFSDSHKQIVPFTDDTDLIEARLDSLKEMELNRGGTNLRATLKESAQYFLNAQGSGYDLGNILVLTDAEETVDAFELDFPPEISVAIVGVGSANGAKIPIRDSRGIFRGNKQFNGEDIVTKLDESFLKKISNEISHYHYWVAGSYSMPTEEVLVFFDSSLKTKEGETVMRVRPVLTNYLIVPAVIIFIIVFVMRNLKAFTLPLLLFISFFHEVEAQDYEIEGPKKTAIIKELETRLLNNNLDDQGKKQLAYELLKEGFYETSRDLYNEILPEKLSDENLDEFFNKGAAQLKSTEVLDGVNTYGDIIAHLEGREDSRSIDMINKAKSNILNALNQMDEQSKSGQQSDSNEEQDQQDNNDQQENEGEGQTQSNQKGDQSESSDQEPQQSNPSQSEGDEESDEENTDEQDQEDEQDNDSETNKNDNNQSEDDQEESGEQQSENDNEEMPAILKQLMSDDNQLQKKVIDTQTVDGKTQGKKDW